jgi:hypothetical protein
MPPPESLYQAELRCRGELLTTAWAMSRPWATQIAASWLAGTGAGACFVQVWHQDRLVAEYASAADAAVDDLPAPAALERYLEHAGWRRDGDRNGARVWRLGDRARVLVPPDDGDYGYEDEDDVLRDTLSQVARAEHRPVAAIRQAISERA